MLPYADGPTYRWPAGEFKKAGKKFDMGKSCLHVQRYDDLVPEAIATVIRGWTPAQFIKAHEASRAALKTKKRQRVSTAEPPAR